MKLIIVANRLPITLNKTNGDYQMTQSSGGLVSALQGIETPFVWIGWPGLEVEPKDQPMMNDLLGNNIPVYLTNQMVHDYYDIMSNSVIWPIFAYEISRVKHEFFNEWIAYKKVNQLFVDVIMENYNEGDIVWIHDYHLMLVPKMLRERNPNMKIGFFLHIPFPTFELFRIMPMKKEILEGIMGANLIGFHCHDYTRHFATSVKSTFGHTISIHGSHIFGYDHLIKIDVFPIGISPQHFLSTTNSEATQKRIQELRTEFKANQILLGIDRVDYTKGLYLKFEAFKLYLDEHPNSNVVFIQIGVPTRESIQEYQDLKHELNELIGEINSIHGRIGYTPILFFNKSINRTELCALYATANVCIIGSVRDGMNLVAMEFVACNPTGCLLVSEFAGCANSLVGSIRYNPWSIQEGSKMIEKAIEMDTEEIRKRHFMNHQIVMKNTSQKWCQDFVDELNSVSGYHPRDSLPKCSNFANRKVIFASSTCNLMDPSIKTIVNGTNVVNVSSSCDHLMLKGILSLCRHFQERMTNAKIVMKKEGIELAYDDIEANQNQIREMIMFIPQVLGHVELQINNNKMYFEGYYNHISHLLDQYCQWYDPKDIIAVGNDVYDEVLFHEVNARGGTSVLVFGTQEWTCATWKIE